MPTSVQEKRQPFSKGIIRFFGILLLLRHPSFPPSFRAWSADTTILAMLRLHMALCHASCSRQASNLRRTPFRGVPLPVGLRELGRLFLTTVDLRGRYHLERPERKGEEWDAGHGEECEGIVFFRPTIPRNGVPLPCPANE